jgi:hypothetical protein
MIGINRAVIQRTSGLHEIEARRQSTNMNANAIGKPDAEAEQKRLTYGRQFKYDEFIVMPNAAIAVLVGVAFAIGVAALAFVQPVGALASSILKVLLTRFSVDSLAVQETSHSTWPWPVRRVAPSSSRTALRFAKKNTYHTEKWKAIG